ncbi:TolC family protein [Aquabacterium sp.]|uniref:efflux transporter outer membrane subunit n=1 Tax=Aquabacterium sp. TaxID=1872578 RepID=UPI002489B34D|nr:TolC family protein [Aquabacterium sp.]MDI1261352.1 TolC family protein [Aquabacterium sp.]
MIALVPEFHKRCLVSALVVSLLPACTSVRVAVPAMQEALPTQMDAATARPAGSAMPDLSRWWAGLEDPVLSGYIEEGLKNNLDVRVALARIKEARAYLRVAESAYYPTVAAVAGASRGRQETPSPVQGQLNLPFPLPPLDMPPTKTQGNTHAFGLDAVWEIDIFGARHSDADMVGELVMGAHEQKHGAQLMVASDIATNYFEARGAERRLGLLYQGVTVAQRLHLYASGRFNAGQTTASEVDRAALQLDFTESQIEPLKAKLQSHVRRIAVLMGHVPESLKVLPLQPVSSHLPTELPEVLPSDVLERRPDVRGAARKVRSQAAKLGSAKAELFPKFYLGFGVLSGRIHPDHIEGRNFSIQSMGIGMRLPLLEGGRIRANIAANEAQLEGVAVQYEQTVLAALEDVENAYTAKKSFDVRFEKLGNSARLARKVAEHKHALFVNGQELLQAALEAEATALQREDETIQVNVSQALYTVLLYKALGGGWSADFSPAAPPRLPD